MALILGEGEINDITQIFVNDNQVTWSGDLADNTERTVGSGDSNYYKDSASLITVRPHYGADDQSACSLLSTLTSWTSNHRLRGVAYLSLRFEWNSDAFGSIPTVQAIVQGKKFIIQILMELKQVAQVHIEKIQVLLGNIQTILFINY